MDHRVQEGKKRLLTQIPVHIPMQQIRDHEESRKHEMMKRKKPQLLNLIQLDLTQIEVTQPQHIHILKYIWKKYLQRLCMY